MSFADLSVSAVRLFSRRSRQLLKDPSRREWLQDISRVCSRASSSRASSSTAPPPRQPMRQWQVTSYGGIDKLSLVETAMVPTVRKPDDLLVKVHASSVNQVDVKMIGGYGATLMKVMRKAQGLLNNGSEFPLVPGRDFSGVVMATGKGPAASRFKQGDEVYGAAVPIQPRGCLAEYVIVPAIGAVKKPVSLAHTEAASLPYVTLTAWSALCTAAHLSSKNTNNKRVLILGGSGAVGTLAVQLVKAWGGQVTTTCAADAADMMADLGADVTLDYKAPTLQQDLTDLKGFDVIFDCVADRSEQYMPLLGRHDTCTYVTVITPILRDTDQLGVALGGMKAALDLGSKAFKGAISRQNYRWGLAQISPNAMREVTDLVNKQRVKPVIDRTYPFEEVPDAFRKVLSGPNRGKTVISIC